MIKRLSVVVAAFILSIGESGIRNISLLPPLALAQTSVNVTFTDIALEAGFQDRLGHGRALVAADFNRDGRVDFYVGNPSDPALSNDDCFILWNNGPDANGNITFTKGQVLFKGTICFTASAVDYDNDGDPDLFVGIGGQEGIGLDYLFRNDGGVFTDVSGIAGIRGPKDSNGNWVPTATSSGTWADYDNDGDLDLFVASRLHGDSLILPGNLGWRNSLFRNNGDGTFTDVTGAAGVGGTLSSMTSVWGDFDNDGWMDLYVPHYEPPGFQLYRNNKDGTFTEVPLDEAALSYGTRASWAASVAEFNNDGWLDVISFARGVVETNDSHALLINHGNWSFTNEALSSGLAIAGVKPPRVMGTAVGDLNNDGYPDVFMGNGGPDIGEIDKLYLNNYTAQTGLTFEDISNLIDFPAPPDPNCVPPSVNSASNGPSFIHPDMTQGTADDGVSISTSALSSAIDPCNPPYPYRGHGAMFIDIDKDGDLDLLVVKGGTEIVEPDIWSGEPNRYFRNDGGNAKNWLFIELEGTVGNRDALGSGIKVTASQGGSNPRNIFQQWQGNTGFSASGPREVHFGLGDGDTVDQIKVNWPSGVETVLTGVSINQRLKVSEGTIFSSNFNGGAANGWTPLMGSWSVVDNEYVQGASGKAMAINTSGSLADYSVVGKLTYISGNKQMGLLGRVSPDGMTYYGAILLDSKAQLYKSIGGTLTPLGSPVAISPMKPGRSYIVRLTLNGSSIQMSVDRQVSPAVNDASIASGSIGLSTNNSSAAFDNVAVY